MKYLKYHREKVGFSQKKLALMLEVDENTVWRWEKNKSNPPSDMAIKIAEALGISVDELLNGPADDELKFNIVWEVDEMNMIDVPNNEVFLGFKPRFNVIAGAFPEEADPDEIGRRVAMELRAARVARDARDMELKKGEA